MDKSPYSTSSNVDVFLGDKKILGFDVDEIGDNEDNSRNLAVLAFPKEIDTLVEEIERWKNSEDWYISKSIPWKRGLLLYSSPGCGKTSLVKALGQYLDLPIHVFDLASMSNYDFTNSWEDMLGNTPCIALVEDVDAVFVGRENVRNKNNNMDLLTFDCFLNNIDGVQNTDGLFLVVTTNRVEVLDEALGKPRTGNVNGSRISTRPGRIDRAFELKTMDRDCRMKVAKRILSDCPVEMIEKVIDSSEQYSGAQVVEICTQIALKYFWEHKK
jgi:SpoVK/Ycf46/Vps4 family AAA+-type ATPase